jgi:hypothetical protein
VSVKQLSRCRLSYRLPLPFLALPALLVQLATPATLVRLAQPAQL